jgi:hypothetical protein
MTPEEQQLAQSIADKLYLDFISQVITAANKPYSISWPNTQKTKTNPPKSS